MPVLSRYDEATDSVQNVKACPLGRYDPTDSESEAESEAGEEMLLGTHRFLESSLRSDGGSSNGDSQGSDGESDSDVGATRGSVNISSERLLSMHAVASQDSMQKSCYAEHGTCKARVKGFALPSMLLPLQGTFSNTTTCGDGFLDALEEGPGHSLVEHTKGGSGLKEGLVH